MVFIKKKKDLFYFVSSFLTHFILHHNLKKSKKETILDLNKWINQSVLVKFVGGREGLYNFSSHPFFSFCFC